MNDLVLSENANFNVMAQAMGIDNETGGSSSTLARIRIHHNAIMGTTEIDGKRMKIEVVEGGTFKLEIPDGPTYYAKSARFRPFMQRFMYQRFIPSSGDRPNTFIKTVMANDLNSDLKDNFGTFNCGKPSGYIKDFKALSTSMQDLIRATKRVRVMFGVIELIDPVDETGEEVDVGATPVIWEVNNRDAFKDLGEVFKKFVQMKHLPPQHYVDLSTKEVPLPNGDSFYLPTAKVDSELIPLTDEDQSMFHDFVSWVENYNNYVMNAWNDKAIRNAEDEDASDIQDYVDLDIEMED